MPPAGHVLTSAQDAGPGTGSGARRGVLWGQRYLIRDPELDSCRILHLPFVVATKKPPDSLIWVPRVPPWLADTPPRHGGLE